jgi:hypothetical protein
MTASHRHAQAACHLAFLEQRGQGRHHRR